MPIDLHLLSSVISDDLSSHAPAEGWNASATQKGWDAIAALRAVQLVTLGEDAIARGQALAPSQKEALLDAIGRQVDMTIADPQRTTGSELSDILSATHEAYLDLLSELRSWPTVGSIAVPGHDRGAVRPSLEQLEHLEHLRV